MEVSVKRELTVFTTGKRQNNIKSKLWIFSSSVCGAMTRIPWRNTSLRRYDDVIHYEICVIARHRVNERKNAILIQCGFVLPPMRIHPFDFVFKYPKV